MGKNIILKYKIKFSLILSIHVHVIIWEQFLKLLNEIRFEVGL